ncbi:MAG: hypothetical protein E7528_04255 [Ruminococcaceae bacterium]|nr:hypothetical protein [Oscillospiraceae bacterium]
MELTKKSSNGYYTLKLILTEGDYSVTDNTSPVSYELQLISGANAHFTDFRIGTKVVLDGKTVNEVARANAKQYTLGYNSKITLASGTVDIEHDADGSKTIAVSFNIDMASYSYTAGAVSGSGSMELTDIPRKATVTSVTKFTDEENPIVKFSNPGGFQLEPYLNVWVDGAIIHQIKKTKGKYTSPYTFTLTDAERTALRNACNTSNSYTNVTLGFVTYNGNTSLGSNSKSTTLSIVNADPIFDASTIIFEDVDAVTVGITGNNQMIVQNKSFLNVTCGTATGQKGAKISKYTFTLNGVTKTLTGEKGGTTSMGTVAKDGDLILVVTAIDSRGNSAKAEVPIAIIPYQKPILTRHENYGQITCERCDAEGVIDKNGTYLKLIIQGKWYSLLNGENTATVDVQITGKDYESAWITVPAEVVGGGAENAYQSWYNINAVVEGVTFDINKAYVVTVRCVDSFGDSDDETTYTDLSYKIPTCAVALHLGKGGNKAALGTYADEDFVFKIDENWTLKYKEKYIKVDDNGNVVASTVK